MTLSPIYMRQVASGLDMYRIELSDALMCVPENTDRSFRPICDIV